FLCIFGIGLLMYSLWLEVSDKNRISKFTIFLLLYLCTSHIALELNPTIVMHAHYFKCINKFSIYEQLFECFEYCFC
ncbi:hypothetical protein ACJX0J_025177, partial [Zea mays]